MLLMTYPENTIIRTAKRVACHVLLRGIAVRVLLYVSVVYKSTYDASCYAAADAHVCRWS